MKLRWNRWYIDLKETLTTNDLSVTLKQTKQRRLCNSASQLHIFILFVRNSKGILFETRCICPRDLGFPNEWYEYNVCYSLEKKKVCWIKEEHVTPMTSHKIPSIPAAGFPTPAPIIRPSPAASWPYHLPLLNVLTVDRLHLNILPKKL